MMTKTQENNIKANDIVLLIKEKDDIPINSVGIAKNLSGNEVEVYFIGVDKSIKLNLNYIEYLDVSKTGKPYDMKICNICHILKNMDEFDINQTDAKQIKTTRPSCKLCRVEINGASMMPAEKRRLDAEKPTGVFKCPICNKKSIVGVTANLVKDHDHKTGKGREWICDSCNTGLGRFKDDIGLLQRAIDYIKKYS